MDDTRGGSRHPSTDPTLVGRLMQSRLALAVMSAAPVPLSLVKVILLRDNAAENAKDSWSRLRDEQEAARYAAVRAVTERYAANGFVLDVGCSQGILQEGLRYRRYLGVDAFPDAIARASVKADDVTAFVCADGATFVADEPPDAVVLNEVVYYLPDPVGAVLHHARRLSPDGVIIVSIYAGSWSSRRLLRQLAQRLDVVERSTATSGHLAWSIVAFSPRSDLGSAEGARSAPGTL